MSVNQFGRRHAPDYRDQAFPMKAVLRPAPILRPFRNYWMPGDKTPMDQGETGTCVAHAWTAFLLGSPMTCDNPPDVFETYRGIVPLDEWPDNDHEATAPIPGLQSGTSVRAGAKYLQGKGFVQSYVWAHGADDCANWILTGKGTVVMGTDWEWNMSEPDKRTGIISLGGGMAGGHSWLLVGYNKLTGLFTGLNSWGRLWGLNGRFRIRFADLDTLIKRDGGEACAAIEQAVTPIIE